MTSVLLLLVALSMHLQHLPEVISATVVFGAINVYMQYLDPKARLKMKLTLENISLQNEKLELEIDQLSSNQSKGVLKNDSRVSR